MAFNGLGVLPALQLDNDRIASMAPLAAFRQGEQDQLAANKRGLLKDVGGQMAGGDMSGAAATAMRGGEIDTGLSIKKHAVDLRNADRDMMLKAHEFLNNGVKRADTPEKWKALVDTARRTFGDEMVKGYEDFKSRPQAMTAMEQAELQLKQAQAAAAGTKNELDAAIAGMLTQGGNPQAVPPSVQPQSAPQGMAVPQTGVLPISNEAAAPAGYLSVGSGAPPSGLILAADDGQAPETEDGVQLPDVESGGAQPYNPSAVYNLPGNEIVHTPFGDMTRDKARRLGMGLAAAGKGAAGKMMMEAAGGQDRPDKAGRNILDKKQIDAVNHIARLNEVQETMKPDYLEIPTRLNMAWKSGLAKFGSLAQKDQAQLKDYATARRAAVNNMSRLLNELSGAAVSPQEYQRIIKTQPDAGIGLFDGDDPVSFQGKLEGARREQLRAIARYNYLRNMGFAGKPWEAMPLDEVEGVIDKRGAEIEKELKPKGLDPTTLQEEIKTRLSTEFGIPI